MENEIRMYAEADFERSRSEKRGKIQRMLLCAWLGISEEMLKIPAPYVRAQAFNDTGRAVLKQAREGLQVINAGEAIDHPYYPLECRCADLYALTRLDTIEPPGGEEKQRIYYHKESP